MVHYLKDSQDRLWKAELHYKGPSGHHPGYYDLSLQVDIDEWDYKGTMRMDLLRDGSVFTWPSYTSRDYDFDIGQQNFRQVRDKEELFVAML